MLTSLASNPAVLAALIASDTHIEDVRRAVARARTEAEGDMDETIELAIDMLVSLEPYASAPLWSVLTSGCDDIETHT